MQEYCKAQKQLGVLLTVCSKNEPENAKLGLSHPDSVLHEEDFVTICANWEPKDQNLLHTAETLSLLPESFVFVDDNPAERDIVSAQIPGIAVPAFGSPADCIRVLDHAGYFETTTFSAADASRSEMYRANAQRAADAADLRQLHRLSAGAGYARRDPGLRPGGTSPHRPADQQEQPVQSDHTALYPERDGTGRRRSTSISDFTDGCGTSSATTALSPS